MSSYDWLLYIRTYSCAYVGFRVSASANYIELSTIQYHTYYSTIHFRSAFTYIQQNQKTCPFFQNPSFEKLKTQNFCLSLPTFLYWIQQSRPSPFASALACIDALNLSRMDTTSSNRLVELCISNIFCRSLSSLTSIPASHMPNADPP